MAKSVRLVAPRRSVFFASATLPLPLKCSITRSVMSTLYFGERIKLIFQEFKHLYECDFCEQYFVDRMSHKRHLVSCPSRHAPLQPASGPVEQRQSLPEMGADGVLFHRVLQWGFKFKCFDCCRVSGERRWYEGKDALMLHKVKSHQGDSSSSAMTASRIGAHESRPVATANALRHEQATLSGRANSGVSAAGDTASPNVPNACGLCGDPFIHCAALEAHMNTVHERCESLSSWY